MESRHEDTSLNEKELDINVLRTVWYVLFLICPGLSAFLIIAITEVLPFHSFDSSLNEYLLNNTL